MTTRTDVRVIYDTDPRLIIVDVPSTEITIQDLHDTLSVIDAQFTSMSFPHTINTSGKENLGGGVFVGLTSTLQNAQLSFERRTTRVSVGTITTLGVEGAFFEIVTDIGATFIADGVARGDIVVNLTDDSYAEVISIDSETQLSVLSPTGGADNNYQVSDSYEVWLHETGDITGGNLVAVETDGVTLLQQTFPTFGVGLVRASSSSATLAEQADIQYSSFGGGVTIDVTSTNTGTIFPVGTPREPVNNLADAHTILETRGFDRFFVRGDLTVDSGTHDHLFSGQAVSVTTLILDPAADLTGARFENATITGTLDGDAALSQCNIQTLNFFNGVISGCVLSGTITLGGGVEGLILDCFSDVGGATIDLGGSGQGLDLQNFNGSVTLTNKTGVDNVFVGMSSGEITIDNTVTTGTLTLTGVGKWLNRTTYSGGATIINELIDATDIQQTSFEGQVIVDVINGVSGTVYPRGTSNLPVDNIPDAVSIAGTVGLGKILIIGNITLDTGDSLDGFMIFGQNASLSTITVNAGASTVDCEFQECILVGTLDGNSIIRNSVVGAVSNFNGVLFNSLLAGPLTLGGGAQANLLNCYSGVAGSAATPILDMGGSGQALTIRNYAGGIEIQNRTGTDAVSIDMNSGQIIVNNTVTAGSLTLRGVGKWTNESTYAGGATVNNELLSTGTIVTAFDANTYDGTTLSDLLQDLLAMASGRIVESPIGTFTFYERDNTTIRFVLTKSGNERTRS